MKRVGIFFLISLGEEKGGGGQLTFYSIFSGGKKYTGRYGLLTLLFLEKM